MPMLALSQGILMGACLLALAQLFRIPRALSGPEKNQAGMLSLVFLLIALAALGDLLALRATHPDSQTLSRLLGQLRDFIALPMLASLLLCRRLGYQVGRIGWGRWFLALFALFELMRRLGYGEDYRLVLLASSSAALLASALRPLNAYGMSGALLIGASALLSVSAVLGPLLLAAGLVLISLSWRQQTLANQ